MRRTLIIFFILNVFVFISCSGSNQNMKNIEPLLYPPPPDEPRIQYLTSFSKSTDFTGEQSVFSNFIVGEEDPLLILKPYGIATGIKKIYICDTQLGGLEVIEIENGEFSYFIPEGRGKLKNPINCFVDDAGFLYVADTERGQIVIFNNELDYVGEIGDSSIIRPTDVFVNDKEIFINDITKQSVEVFDRFSLKHIKSIPVITEGKNKLFSPTNIHVSKEKIYISDIGDSKVKVYDLDGNFVNSVGSIGISPGKFSRPKGISVDREENLYVVDAGFENVQVFNKEGKLLMYFGGSYSKSGDMWLPAKVAIDYNNIEYYQKYVDSTFDLKYLIFVTNQYGPDKVNVYGFISKKS